jgi:hypothetical protein
MGQIPPNGLVERVRTRRPDRSVAAAALGLGWAGRGQGEAGKVGLVARFWPIAKEKIGNSFSFIQVV